MSLTMPAPLATANATTVGLLTSNISNKGGIVMAKRGFPLTRRPQMTDETKNSRTGPTTNPTEVPAPPAKRDFM